MTALCGGGSSGPKAGVDSAIALGGTAIDAMVSALGFPELSPIIGVVAAGLAFATDEYCTTDPPDDPGLTLQDFTDAQQSDDPAAYATAVGRIKDWVLNQYWWKVCSCSGGSTPAAPPANLPTGFAQSPGLPSGGITGPCWDVTLPVHLPQPAGSGTPAAQPVQLTNQIAPTTVSSTWDVNGDGSVILPIMQIPAGVSHVTLTITTSTPTGGNGIQLTMNQLSSAKALLATSAALAAGGATTHTTTIATLNSSAVWWRFGAQATDIGVDYDTTCEMSFQCASGSTGSVTTPCCPPDPILQNYLQQIQNMLSIALSEIDQLALQNPTEWAEGPVHSGLSGKGSFGISGGAIAVKLHMDTIPPQLGDVLDSPTYYFDAGFITFTTLEGSYSGQRITYADQVFSVPFMGYQVDYTLNMGTTATVTELVRPT